MARDILGIEHTRGLRAHLASFPVENNTRFPINKDLFLDLIRSQLNEKARGKVLFWLAPPVPTAALRRSCKRSNGNGPQESGVVTQSWKAGG